MKKHLEILFNLVLFILVNWYCYHKIDVPLAFGDVLFIAMVLLFSLAISVVITVKNFNIADYWSFARKHYFAYALIFSFIFVFLVGDAPQLYRYIGTPLFALVNMSLLSLLIIEEERGKQRKERKKMHNSNS